MTVLFFYYKGVVSWRNGSYDVINPLNSVNICVSSAKEGVAGAEKYRYGKNEKLFN